MENRARIHALFCSTICPAVVVTIEHVAVAHDEDARPDNAITIGVRIENSKEAAPIVRCTRYGRVAIGRRLRDEHCRQCDDPNEMTECGFHVGILGFRGLRGKAQIEPPRSLIFIRIILRRSAFVCHLPFTIAE